MADLMKNIASIFLAIVLLALPANAARETDSYDGNIFFLYAANGSLVPPTTTLANSLERKRTSVIVFYLDDSATSKQFAPVVSALKLVWGSEIDILPYTTDEIQRHPSEDPREPAYYWHGRIPQTVVIDGNGTIQLDQEGQVSVKELNSSISRATGLEEPSYNLTIKSFNEYNSEPSKGKNSSKTN